jgi:nucleoside-diphosphate-sugar epimerase
LDDQEEQMNVAIIGCGYVGTAIARYWHQEQGLFVTATTTTPERVSELEAIAQRVIVTKGNDAEKLPSVVENQEVILLSVGAANTNVYKETYLDTAKTLAEVLQQAPTVRQLIYTGSYGVYGDRGGETVDEDSPIAPASPTGEILAQTEQVLLGCASDRIKVCILRLGGIYGPRRELAKIFSRVAGTTIAGDGSDATNWIHLDDIVSAIDFARTQQLQGIYNLVNEVSLTRRELLDQVCDRHNLPQVSWNPAEQQLRPYNARVSPQKIKAAGYKFIHPQITE